MLHVNQVSKYYGPQLILEDISFSVTPGERVGLVGPNGCGKSTLLRIIAGVERPDDGHVSFDSGVTLGYLPQGHDSSPDRTIAEEVRAGVQGLDIAWRKMEDLAGQMTTTTGDEQLRLVEAYGEAQTRFEALGGYAVEHRIPSILAGLGLESLSLDAPLSQLSGGQRARVGLARLLIAEPTFLLLDEPTNHLDIATLEWLEQFVNSYAGAALIVSHDRVFLDNTITRVLEIDSLTHRTTEYGGNYSDYLAAKTKNEAKQWDAWRDQQAEVRRVEADIRRTKGQAMHNERSTNNDVVRRLAKKVAKKAKSRERRLERYLESEERIDKPQRTWGLKLEFGDMPRGGQIVLDLDGVGHSFGERRLFHDVNLSLTHGDRIALLGPNGSGKTTLLKIIAGQLQPDEGLVHVGANVRLGYMPQQQESLDPKATPLSLMLQTSSMNETEARNFLHFFLFGGDEVFVPIGSLSYGERARLLLAKMIVAGANCLILDEPINHLDIRSRERFEEALDAFPGTILAAVHDRAFIDRFAESIWSVEDETIRHYFDRLTMKRQPQGEAIR